MADGFCLRYPTFQRAKHSFTGTLANNCGAMIRIVFTIRLRIFLSIPAMVCSRGRAGEHRLCFRFSQNVPRWSVAQWSNLGPRQASGRYKRGHCQTALASARRQVHPTHQPRGTLIHNAIL
jgi:hypothetical protein